jgi:uncharacterized protein YjiS (DUF1127 family)
MDNSSIAARTLTAPGQSSAETFRARLAKAVKLLLARINRECVPFGGVGDLATVGDHLLTDIGLTREMVEYASRFGRLPRDRGGADTHALKLVDLTNPGATGERVHTAATDGPQGSVDDRNHRLASRSCPTVASPAVT